MSGNKLRRGAGSQRAGSSKDAAPRQFGFVTFNNPNDMNDKELLREIHSHVMHDFLDKQGREGWGKRDETRPRTVRRTSSKTASKSPPLSRRKSKPPGSLVREGSTVSRSSTPSLSHASDRYVSRPASTVSSQSQSRYMRQPYTDMDKLSQLHSLTMSSAGRHQFVPEALRVNPGQPLYPVPAGFEQQFSVVLPCFHDALPSPEKLHFHALCYLDLFGPNSDWIQSCLETRLAYLSSLMIGANYQDMLNGLSESSSLTQAIRHSFVSLLHRVMNEPATSTSDSTLLGACHLVWIGFNDANDATMAHGQFIERVITQRGGMHDHKLDPGLATMIAALCIGGAVVTGAPLSPMHMQFLDIRAANAGHEPIHESPLYFTDPNFTSLANEPLCYGDTIRVISLARDVNVFMAWTNINEILKQDPHVAAIYTELLTMNSARIPGHTNSGDFVYETVRFAALIYTRAALDLVPFCEAAQMVEADLEMTEGTLPGVICAAIGRTDTSQLWDGLISVFFWATAIASAAAYSNVRSTAPPPSGQAILSYKWLHLQMTTTMATLCVNHPQTIYGSLNTFLRVQGMLSTYPHAHRGMSSRPALERSSSSRGKGRAFPRLDLPMYGHSLDPNDPRYPGPY